MELKTQALLAVAMAYFNRGNKIQYDQRCMDRKLITTPRRDKYVSPEDATSQRTVFLDCSSFINVVFWETFGYEIPFELTWHMVDYFHPRVFLYERTYEETPEEIENIKQEIKDSLKIGDVLTFDRFSGSGHTVLYIGNGEFVHCTPNNRPDSYDYKEKKSREYEDGGLFIIDASDLIDDKIFESKTVKRIAIERPLDILDKPTDKAMARITDAKDLICSVETSHPGGHHATKGDTVTYSVTVLNNGSEERDVTVSFKTSEIKKEKILKGKEARFDFKVTLEDDESVFAKAPEIIVNGLLLNAPKVLTGKKISKENLAKVSKSAIKGIIDGKTAIQSASEAYKEIGISFSPNENEHFFKNFYLHDTLSGDVLSRRAQIPSETMGVYSFFGGVAVITPEKISTPYVSCNKPLRRDLMEGDIILICDDNFGINTYSAYYDGTSLTGQFEFGGETKTIEEEELDKFIDSLLGQYSFIVLRPSYKL